jgi:hypothetical protein
VQAESFRVTLDLLGLNLPHPDRVKTPLVVLGSRDDALFSVDEFEATARAYGSGVKLFSGQGHAMMLDVGWPAVADYILEWLNERAI